MVTKLTTRDRVKRRRGIQTQADDQLIDELIAEISDDCERFLGRHVSSESRTEEYEIRAHKHRIRLRGFPVASVTSVKYHLRKGEWGTVTAMDSDLYELDTDTGELYLRTQTPYNPGYVQVVYTGGMVTGATASALTAAFVAEYPSLAGAVDQQIIEYMRRMNSPTGAVGFKGSYVQQFSEMGLLKEVRRRFTRHRMIQV